MKYKVSVVRGFSAAHALREYKGKCEKLHGHNWKVKVILSGNKLNKIGMLMDFTDIKALLDEAISSLDHSYLNDTAPFNKINPTAENISANIFKEVSKNIPVGTKVEEVEVWESDTTSAVVSNK